MTASLIRPQIREISLMADFMMVINIKLLLHGISLLAEQMPAVRDPAASSSLT
jgi:hypothetical protein